MDIYNVDFGPWLTGSLEGVEERNRMSLMGSFNERWLWDLRVTPIIPNIIPVSISISISFSTDSPLQGLLGGILSLRI